MPADPACVRWLRFLLVFLPRSVRAEYGNEILSVCRRRMRAELKNASFLGVARFWIKETLGVSGAIASAWRDALRGIGASAPMVFDVRTVTRGLIRTPLFLALTVATLAVGIGANAGVSSLAWFTFRGALPYADADRLVRLFHNDDLDFGISFNELRLYQRTSQTLAGLGGWTTGSATVLGTDRSTRVALTRMTPNLFDLLGNRPTIGGGFSNDGSGGGVVIAHRFWAQHFGADSAVVGRTILVDEQPHRVLGVQSPDFAFPDATVDLYMPIDLARDRGAGRGGLFLDVVARLTPGASVESARAEIEALADAMRTKDPSAYEAEPRFGGYLAPLRTILVGDTRPLLVALLVATLLLFAASALNVANLLATRSRRRRNELAVRRSLGASTRDLLRLHVLEVAVISGLSGLAALPVAVLAERTLVSWLPLSSLGRAQGEISLSIVPLAALAAAAALTLPLARQLSGIAGPRLAPRATLTVNRFLAPIQAAVALVLVAGAVLLFSTVRNLTSTDLGFQVDGIVSGRVSLPAVRYTEEMDRKVFFRDLVDRLEGRPAIVDAGVVSALPLSGTGGGGDVYVESVALDSALAVVTQRVATPEYFPTIGIPLVAGRLFTPDDRPEGPRVALVDEVFARQFFGRPDDAVGKRIRFFLGGDDWNEVVGVVGHVRHTGPATTGGPQVYVHHGQRVDRSAHIVMRVEGETSDAAEALLEEVRALDPAIAVYDLATMKARVRESIERESFALVAFATFGLLSLLLAGLGLYGVAALQQEQRAREIGIRRALGANGRQITRELVREATALLAAGLGLGVGGALVLGRVLAGLVYGVDATSWTSMSWAALFLFATGVTATVVPIRRALRIDPARVMRAE